jgi:hypothetical protein
MFIPDETVTIPGKFKTHTFIVVRMGDDLTTFIMPKVEKIRGLNLPDPQGPSQACIGKTLPFTFIVMFGSVVMKMKKHCFNMSVHTAHSVAYEVMHNTLCFVLTERLKILGTEDIQKHC